MPRLMVWTLLALAIRSAWAAPPVTVYQHYVSRGRCLGRLLAAATGDPTLLRVEPVSKEMGCAVLLKANQQKTGRTDLILETTTGSVHQMVEVTDRQPRQLSDLETEFQGGGP